MIVCKICLQMYRCSEYLCDFQREKKFYLEFLYDHTRIKTKIRFIIHEIEIPFHYYYLIIY